MPPNLNPHPPDNDEVADAGSTPVPNASADAASGAEPSHGPMVTDSVDSPVRSRGFVKGKEKQRSTARRMAHAPGELKIGLGKSKPGTIPPWPAASGGTAGHPTPTITKPTPLPKRPKGRLFMGTLVVSMCVFVGYQIWTAFFRFQAYGTVVGQVIEVVSTNEGIIRGLLVREGDAVRQDQVLATVDNPMIGQRVSELTTELQIAQANLEAQIARLRWEQRLQSQKLLTDYYELWGTLLQEQSKLMDFKQRFDRATALAGRGATSPEEVDSLQFSVEGQRGKVLKLQTAVDELSRHTELSKDATEENFAQLKPSIAKIEALQSEMERLREQLRLCEVRSPANGRVVCRHRYTGEPVTRTQTIFEILEEDSLRVVLFMPQEQVAKYQVGDPVEVLISPSRHRLPLVVERIGDQFAPPPKHLQRYYRSNLHLLPISLRVSPDQLSELRLGCEVSLPY